MLNPFNPVIDRLTATIVTWWHAHPGQGFLAFTLLAGVVIAVALVLTAAENRRADDELLDRLGSATPGQPATVLDKLLLASRAAAEHDPIPDLVDVDTAIAAMTTTKDGVL